MIKANIIKQSQDKRKKKIWYIIYPESARKNAWDLLIALILIITCCVSPMQIAFFVDDTQFVVYTYLEYAFDLLFFCDIVINFVSAYYDEDYILNDSVKVIANNYLRTWFIIDIIAIFPFWIFASGDTNDSSDVGGVVRIARIGRMWKLIKLTRLIRLIKIVKKKNMNLTHKATKALKIDSALERLFFFLFGTIFIIHILSCLWVFFCSFSGDDEETFRD